MPPTDLDFPLRSPALGDLEWQHLQNQLDISKARRARREEIRGKFRRAIDDEYFESKNKGNSQS